MMLAIVFAAGGRKVIDMMDALLTACWPASCIPGYLTLLMTPSAEIIGATMHDDGELSQHIF